MTIHKSLVIRNKLIRHRNVLSRAERIKKLAADDKWKDEDSVFGLPKVKNIIYKRIKVKKEKAPEATADAAVTTEAAAGTEVAKPGATPDKGEASKGKAEPAKGKEAKKK